MAKEKKTWKLTAEEKREIFERSALGEPSTQIQESYNKVSVQAISQLITTHQEQIKETRERLIKDIPLSDRGVRIKLRQKRYYRLENLIKAGENKKAFVELEKLQSEELRKIAEEMGLKTGGGISVTAQAQAGVHAPVILPEIKKDPTLEPTREKRLTRIKPEPRKKEEE